MHRQKQVDKTTYEFKYVDKQRWASMWHQLDEVIKLKPQSVLEIGPGPGVFKQVAKLFDVKVETLDIDPELHPDHIGVATALPFAGKSYDVVCAFQMLEHLPYDESLAAFAEMARVARKHVVVSLPDAKPLWRYVVHIPKLGEMNIRIPRPFSPEQTHVFDGQHYWEINKKGYRLSKVLADFGKICELNYTYRVKENAYHRFFVFSCK